MAAVRRVPVVDTCPWCLDSHATSIPCKTAAAANTDGNALRFQVLHMRYRRQPRAATLPFAVLIARNSNAQHMCILQALLIMIQNVNDY
jgi:hypothetical protein